MKKLLCLFLSLMLLFLSGCGNDEKSDVVEETATPAPTQTATPEPTVSPTPVPQVSIADYQYYVVTNGTLAVSFKYPSHWINEPGKASIRYTEPVNPGQTPAQLTVTSKVMDIRPGRTEMSNQLKSFLDLVSEHVYDFEAGEYKEGVAMLDTEGIRQKYTARDTETGEAITGYALMVYVRAAKRIYLLHFTAPSSRYDEMSTIIDVIRDSIATT